MTRALSTDLRDRVVAMLAEGASCREAAKAFSVSVASVVRWSQLYRATGSTTPRPPGAWRRPVLLPERDWLLARVAAAPDLTLRALPAELAERGVAASYGAVWAFLPDRATWLTSQRVPARHVLRIYRKRRPGQLRDVSWLAPVLTRCATSATTRPPC